MSYGEYADSGRSLGKILYQLSKIGIPLRIVQEVTVGAGEINYYNKPFASYEWDINDVPTFTFLGEHSHYQRNY